MPRSNIYWVYLRHGNPVYGGGIVCFPNNPKPASQAFKCCLSNDGRFHMLEDAALPYKRGYIIPAKDIAFFLHEDDSHLASDNLTARYIYDIFEPSINSGPCQQQACSYHNP